ncbi:MULTISPECIES: cytochrome c oxidase subunit II [Cyanophyceae]|uniref:cytochrome c oxidase subunit II n=1 Tax=Cyanophyceae TaxID=3028117 RepID=UPI001688B3A0|nr:MULTISPECIES: cytochrome c oxidase subunit II [Cyanophyceae]MBD1914825.1 cytochrome c oxidase subunit II [Phormidium sp. FACHB-77]MBD2029943.1 cytochrome c oxidase subunit II [Phormidium sp. FACHB-322]MBD2049253.1 cytochrome c oxidase subunit II [Leptolyngbya sp. FACHB-60]
MKQIPAPFWTLILGIAVTLISLWVGQNHNLLPVQASEQAPLVDDLFNVMMTIGTALFIVVQGAIVYSLIRFRQPKGDDTDGLPIEGNLPLEAFWTAIPAVIVVGLGLYSVVVFQEMGGFSPGGHHGHGAMVAMAPQESLIDVAPLLAQGLDDDTVFGKTQVYGFGASPLVQMNQPDVTVNVTGMQFAWIFRYPDTGITDGELHIPVGKDVQLKIEAQDVIHSFWVPQFRLKQDALPGEPGELRFVATREGTYPVVCAELCGSYHGAMRTQVIVHSPEDYADWVASRVAEATPTTTVAQPIEKATDAEYLAEIAPDLARSPVQIAQTGLVNH